MTIPARYENGVFRPLQDAPIKEGTVVEAMSSRSFHMPAKGESRRVHKPPSRGTPRLIPALHKAITCHS
jgi:predicted DNA-binding antitoxin AbrB/MazE fold protein